MPVVGTKAAASAQGFGEFAQASTAATYIEDVFSTWLYTGNNTSQTISNGIDLAGKGGLVWIKGRSGATDHALYDTARGATKDLVSNSTAAETTQSTGLTAFNGTGFSIGALAKLNTNAATYASWTIREQPKFFDVVTYTGTGSVLDVAHSLGSIPGCIIIKRTDGGGTLWAVYHQSLGATKDIALDSTSGSGNSSLWNSTAPTSTQFTVGVLGAVNANGGTYVAYIFAHNAGGFGLTGTDNVISCGSYTGNGSATGPTITLGYEPQWLMIKNASGTGNWNMIDNMRGMPVGSADAFLEANTSDAEATANWVSPTATGFNIVSTSSEVNTNTSTYIYIAIRRGPMKVPTSGTSVFEPAIRAGTGTTATVTSNVSPIDMLFSTNRDRVASSVNSFWDRLRGGGVYLNSNATNAEASSTSVSGFDVQNGVTMQGALITNGNSYPYVNYNFKRAPGFFDEVCYTGTGSNTTQTHNLGVVPELIIVKRRDTTDAWDTYSAALSNTEYLVVNTTAAKATGATRWNSTTPTSTVFSLGTSTTTNASGGTYVAYLFATCAGVSKVGSYTGTGALQTINCGFTGGSRFVLIKRTDSTGDWYVYDSARGISSGNDPYLLLNDAAAEVTGTNYVDTTSVGFQVTAAAPAGLNANGGTYIFLAIA